MKYPCFPNQGHSCKCHDTSLSLLSPPREKLRTSFWDINSTQPLSPTLSFGSRRKKPIWTLICPLYYTHQSACIVQQAPWPNKQGVSSLRSKLRVKVKMLPLKRGIQMKSHWFVSPAMAHKPLRARRSNLASSSQGVKYREDQVQRPRSKIRADWACLLEFNRTECGRTASVVRGLWPPCEELEALPEPR